jgi:5-methylcytosine-specific restriction endonuclease McrA
MAPNGQKSAATCRTCKNARQRGRYASDPETARELGKARTRRHRGGLKGNANARKAMCAQGHPYGEVNTYVYKGNRQCKQCRAARGAENYERNRDQRVQGFRDYYAENREAVLTANRRWVEENPERASLISRIKKHRRRAAGTLTVEDWQSVLSLYGDRCLACGAGDVTIDHVIPISRGGSNTADNVQPLCGTCNTKKATKTIDYRPALAAV